MTMDNALTSSSVQNELLERWMAEYGDYILRMCYFYLADRALAEDAAQDTFIKAWKNAQGFERRNGATEKTWLTRIAINTCHSVRRSAWFRHTDRSVQPEDIPQAACRKEDNALYAEVASLPDKLKPVIYLRYYQGLSPDETAETLGINRATVYQRQKKALQLLRRILERSGQDD